MIHEVVMAGFGGQGIMAIGKILAKAGLKEKRNVSWFPSYGPEMRGGTASCSVVIADELVGSPVVTEATEAIVMNTPSYAKFEKKVMRDGKLFVNSSLVQEKSTRDDIKVYYVPANDIAKEIGNPKIANMVMLGAFLAATNATSDKTVINVVSEIFGTKKAFSITNNEEALSRGAACVLHESVAAN